MAFKYKNYYVSYPGSVKIDAALPIDIRTVVSTLNDLYGTAALEDQTWKLAYNGLIVSVNETNEAFMCIDSANPYIAESWKKLNPDLDISGKMINIVVWNGKFYDETDVDHEHQIIDSLVDEEGKYLCLILNEDDDYVYIKSTDIISLENYYTKNEIDTKLIALDSSLQTYVDGEIEDVNNKITDLSTDIYNYVNGEIEDVNNKITDLSTDIYNYVGEQINIINTSIINVSSRVKNNEDQIADISKNINDYINIFNDYIADTSVKLENIDTSLNKHEEDIINLSGDIAELGDKISDLEDHIDASVEELKSADTALDTKIEEVSTRLAELEIGTVDSISTNTPEYLIIDTSKGDVTIDINASTSIDHENFPNTALVTNGYVDEKLAWVEVEGN